MQAQAFLASAVLAKHPCYGEGLDLVPVREGINEVLCSWLRDLGAEDVGGDFEFIADSPDGPHVGVQVQAEWLYLKKHVERANKARRNLGWTLLSVLEKLSYRMEIITPWRGLDIGSDELWYGNTNDEDYRRDWLEMNGLDEVDEDDAGEMDAFKPSDYMKSFDDRKVLDHSRKALRCRQLQRLSQRATDPWVRNFAGHVLRLKRLTDEVDVELRPETHDPVTEPTLVVKWAQDDALDHVLDEYVQHHWDCGDTLPYEIYLPVDSLSEASAAVEAIESGLRTVTALADLCRFLY